MEEEKKPVRMSVQQRELMFDFMMKHPSLANGKFTTPDGAKHKARLQTELSELLNSQPNGVSKSKDKWMKSWMDWRSDVKSKAAKIKKHMNGTGGGPPPTIKLTELEEKLLAYLGDAIVTGHDEVNDSLKTNTSTDNKANVSNILLLNIDGPPQMKMLDGHVEVLEAHVEDVIPQPSPTPSSNSSSSKKASSASSSASSAKKRKGGCGCSSVSTSITDEELANENESLLALSKRQIELEEDKAKTLKKQLELQERQTKAIEDMSSSVCAAMAAFQKYLESKNGPQTVLETLL